MTDGRFFRPFRPRSSRTDVLRGARRTSTPASVPWAEQVELRRHRRGDHRALRAAEWGELAREKQNVRERSSAGAPGRRPPWRTFRVSLARLRCSKSVSAGAGGGVRRDLRRTEDRRRRAADSVARDGGGSRPDVAESGSSNGARTL